ncbi:TPA: HNH endonuclease [Escherichia coli]|nr:HNH endonuclease [Escherichia coli]
MKNGYWCIRYAGTLHYAHRIIWEMFNGPIPEGHQIDHIWHDRLDNRIENLRLVTVTENNRNQSKFKTNKSGVTGVHWDKKRKKWVVTIWNNNKIKYLGGFENIVDAIAVRKSAEMELGYHENHGIGV